MYQISLRISRNLLDQYLTADKSHSSTAFTSKLNTTLNYSLISVWCQDLRRLSLDFTGLSHMVNSISIELLI